MQLINTVILFFTTNKKYHFFFFLLLMIVITSFMMFVYRPLCSITDPYFHHNRILVLMDAFRNGDFPFYLDYNILGSSGYFVKAFYPDLTLMPFAILGIFTNIGFAYNFYIFSITILSGISIYILVKRISCSSFISVSSGLLYSFSFYKIFLTYYYASLPYVMVLAFLPIALLGFFELIRGNYKRWYIFSIGLSLIIYTHLITSVLVCIILFCYFVCSYKRIYNEPKRLLYILISSVFCILLSSYYILPMLEQLRSNSFYFEIYPFLDISNTGLSLSGVFSMMTDNSYSMDYSDFYPKIGYLLTCIVFLRIFIRERSNSIRYADIGVLVGLFFLFLCTVYIPWNSFPFNKLKFIQFPWRFLIFTTLLFAVSGSVYISKLLANSKRKFIFILCLSMFILFSFQSNSNLYKKIIASDCPQLNEDVIKKNVYSSGLEYLPSAVPSREFLITRNDTTKTRQASSIISNILKNGSLLSFNAFIDKPDVVELPLTYYKGYVVSTDEGVTFEPVDQSKNGLVEVRVETLGNIRVWYEGTLVQKISPYISLISFLLLLGCIFYLNRKNNA